MGDGRQFETWLDAREKMFDVKAPHLKSIKTKINANWRTSYITNLTQKSRYLKL